MSDSLRERVRRPVCPDPTEVSVNAPGPVHLYGDTPPRVMRGSRLPSVRIDADILHDGRTKDVGRSADIRTWLRRNAPTVELQDLQTGSRLCHRGAPGVGWLTACGLRIGRTCAGHSMR